MKYIAPFLAISWLLAAVSSLSAQTAPSVSITSPADGSQFLATDSIQVTASATPDTVENHSIQQVTFTLTDDNGEFPPVVVVDTTFPYEATFTSADYLESAQNMEISAVAVDTNGDASPAATVSVSTTTPVPTASMVFPSSTDPASPDIVSAGTVYTLRANAAAENGSTASNDISGQFFIDGVRVNGSSIQGSPATFQWTPSPTAKTGVPLSVRYTVTSGISGQTGTSQTTYLMIAPNGPPSVTLNSPAVTTVTVGTTVTLRGSAGDSDGTVTGVEIFANGTKVGDAALAGNGTFTLDWTPTVSGSFSLTAVATDNGGNSATSSPVSLSVVSGGAPEVSLNTPPITELTVGNTVTLRGRAADPDGFVASLAAYANGVQVGSPSLQPDGSFAFEWRPTLTGDFEVFVVATDNLGIQQTSNTVEFSVVGIQDPVVELLPLPEVVTVGSTLQLAAIGQDPDGDVVEVSFFVDGRLIESVPVPETGNPFVAEWVPQSSGDFSIQAVALDGNGATGTSEVQNITIKPVVGARPFGTPISFPATSLGRYFLGSEVLLSVSASDSDGTVESVVVQVNGETIANFSEPPYAVPFILTREGNFVVTTLITDNDGNISSSSILLEALDANFPIPEVDITSPTGDVVALPDEGVAFEAEADGQGRVIESVQFYADNRLFGQPTASPYTATFTEDEIGEFDIRAIAFYTAQITFFFPGGDQITLTYTASRISDTVIVTVADGVNSDGFGELVPTANPTEFESNTFGSLFFPNGDTSGDWAFSNDLDSWLGRTSDDRIWSAEYGFLSPNADQAPRTLDSSIFGPMVFFERGEIDPSAIWFFTRDMKWFAKFPGTSFFFSPTLNGYVGTTPQGGLWSFSWDWIRPVAEWTIESSREGQLFLSDDPALNGAVFSPAKRTFLFP